MCRAIEATFFRIGFISRKVNKEKNNNVREYSSQYLTSGYLIIDGSHRGWIIKAL